MGRRRKRPPGFQTHGPHDSMDGLTILDWVKKDPHRLVTRLELYNVISAGVNTLEEKLRAVAARVALLEGPPLEAAQEPLKVDEEVKADMDDLAQTFEDGVAGDRVGGEPPFLPVSG